MEPPRFLFDVRAFSLGRNVFSFGDDVFVTDKYDDGVVVMMMATKTETIQSQ